MATTPLTSTQAPLGFATVYQIHGGGQVGLWLTSATGPLGAGHTNAVVTTSDDRNTIEALLDRRIVVVAGEATPDVPNPITVDELRTLFREAVADLRGRVDAVVAEHSRATKNRNLVHPDWRHEPEPSHPASDAIEHRTLAVADYVAALWRWWLSVEDERRKRVSFPAMAAAGLADPRLELLPSAVVMRRI